MSDKANTRRSVSSARRSNGSGPTRMIQVSVGDQEIVLNDFHETDPDVVAMARQAEDPEAATHNALQVGARAIKLAGGAVDAQVVEEAFNGLSDSFEETLSATTLAITEVTEALLDSDDGALPAALTSFREELDGMLEEAFDEDSKSSIIGRFDKLVRDLRREESKAIRDLLDSGSDQSPLYRLKRDLKQSVRDEAEGVRRLIGDLAEKVAAEAAATEMFEKTAIKGGAFEDIVHDVTSELVAPYGDATSRTADEIGCAGNKKGDETVILNMEDTQGAEARFTIEAKDRRLSLDATLAELDSAMRNREALAAIAVFSRAEYAPMTVPFAYNGDRAIVVLDKDGVDTTALRLATMWARWVVRRKLGCEGGDIDIEAVEGLIDEAASALNRHTVIKRFHSTARKSIDQAAAQVAELVREVDSALSELRDQLR